MPSLIAAGSALLGACIGGAFSWLSSRTASQAQLAAVREEHRLNRRSDAYVALLEHLSEWHQWSRLVHPSARMSGEFEPSARPPLVMPPQLEAIVRAYWSGAIRGPFEKWSRAAAECTTAAMRQDAAIQQLQSDNPPALAQWVGEKENAQDLVRKAFQAMSDASDELAEAINLELTGYADSARAAT